VNAFRIGRMFGIDVYVDWSWLFIFVLLTWSLFSVFTGWHPDWPSAETIGVGSSRSRRFAGFRPSNGPVLRSPA
jgi:hypothetical protein